MPWPQTGTTHYIAQLGLLEKGRAIKGFVVLVLRYFKGLKPKIYFKQGQLCPHVAKQKHNICQFIYHFILMHILY